MAALYGIASPWFWVWIVTIGGGAVLWLWALIGFVAGRGRSRKLALVAVAVFPVALYLLLARSNARWDASCASGNDPGNDWRASNWFACPF
jgi:hypothetical protein